MKLYNVSRDFIMFNLNVIWDETSEYGVNPNFDLHHEVECLMNMAYKYKGRLPYKEYARVKELALAREITRDRILNKCNVF